MFLKISAAAGGACIAFSADRISDLALMLLDLGWLLLSAVAHLN